MLFKCANFKVFYTFLLPNGEESLTTELFEIDRDTGKKCCKKSLGFFCQPVQIFDSDYV